MVQLPKLNLENVFSIIDKASNAIDNGLVLIDKINDKFDRLGISEPLPATGSYENHKEEEPPSATITQPTTLIQSDEKPIEDIATGCLPCAVSHFSTSAGLLNEAVRFKGDGITSNEILDRIASAIEEQNALERIDLSPVKIQHLPEWERPIAEEALTRSRQLRHKLEDIQSVEELERIAADTKQYYLRLNRQWYKGKFGKLGTEKAEAISQRIGEE